MSKQNYSNHSHQHKKNGNNKNSTVKDQEKQSSVDDIKNQYFKGTYDYLLKLFDKGVPLDKVFDSIKDFVEKEFKKKKKEGKHEYEDILTTTQLRNIYTKVVLTKEVSELKMLRPNLAYIAARQNKAKNIIKFIDQLIQKVNNEQQLKSFKKVMESFVAYHKFHHNSK